MCLTNWTRADTWFAVFSGSVLALIVGGLGGAGTVMSARELVPLSYELLAVSVDPVTPIGQDVRVWPTKEYRRPASLRAEVAVYRVGAADPVCRGVVPVPQPRVVPSTAPAAVTLDWWTAGAQPPCQAALTPGRFVLDTCIIMRARGWLGAILGERESCAVSNEFEVIP